MQAAHERPSGFNDMVVRQPIAELYVHHIVALSIY